MAAANLTRRIITSPNLPKPLAPYSHGVQIGNSLYISGQIGIDKNGDILPGGIVPEAKQTLTNLGNVLTAAGTSFKNVIKVNVLLADIKDSDAVNAIYKEFFTERLPTRVMFQAAALPRNARIEIEAFAVIGDITDIP